MRSSYRFFCDHLSPKSIQSVERQAKKSELFSSKCCATICFGVTIYVWQKLNDVSTEEPKLQSWLFLAKIIEFHFFSFSRKNDQIMKSCLPASTISFESPSRQGNHIQVFRDSFEIKVICCTNRLLKDCSKIENGAIGTHFYKTTRTH